MPFHRSDGGQRSAGVGNLLLSPSRNRTSFYISASNHNCSLLGLVIAHCGATAASCGEHCHQPLQITKLVLNQVCVYSFGLFSFFPNKINHYAEVLVSKVSLDSDIIGFQFDIVKCVKHAIGTEDGKSLITSSCLSLCSAKL